MELGALRSESHDPAMLGLDALFAAAEYQADRKHGSASEAKLRKLLEQLRASQEPASIHIISALVWLAGVVEGRGSSKEADALRSEAREIALRVYGPKQPHVK